jgi:4-amino-4-deoxy-L-arabinose transferase-like glycosyltransferase
MFASRAFDNLVWVEALVIVLCVFNVSYKIQTSKIGEYDEARYGVSAFEMLVTNNVWINTYASERDFANLKPPLGLWVISTSYRIVGITPLGLRLPSMMAAILCVWLTIRLGRRYGGPPAGILAGAILATTFPFILRHGARTGNFDALFTLLITLALWLTLACNRHQAQVLSGLIGLVLALGFLVKSWAVGPFVLAALLSILWMQRRPVAFVNIAWVSLTFMVPLLCWALARWLVDGPEFLQRMLTYDLLQRASDTIEAASAQPFYYVSFLGDRFAPWAAILVLGSILLLVKSIGTDRPSIGCPGEKPYILLLAWWSLLPLALLSLTRSRYHWYINPILPALALATAFVIMQLFRVTHKPMLKMLMLGVIVLGLCINEHRILAAIQEEQYGKSQNFLRTMPLPDAATICAFRPWTQRERWILAASRGATLCQIASIDEPLPANAPGVLLLIDRGTPEETRIRQDGRFRVVKSPYYLVARKRKDIRGDAGGMAGL